MTFKDIHPGKRYFLMRNGLIDIFYIESISEKVIGIRHIAHPERGPSGPPIFYLIDDFLCKYDIIEEVA